MTIHTKKCPPGVICIENITLVFLVIILCVLFYIIYIYFFKNQKQLMNQQPSHQQPQSPQKIDIFNSIYNNTDAGYGYGYGDSNDVLLNPYVPPLRDETYFNNPNNISPVFMPKSMYTRPRAIPINVSTNIGAASPDTPYRQVGILTPINGSKKNSILPLMGRPVFTNRDKWQYYTISDQHNNVKIPISRKGKSCTNEYGCDYIYNGDTVYAEGYNEVFKATVYDNDTIRYLPFL
jgi:ABC-type glycerol-3-phosphate transport system permease component